MGSNNRDVQPHNYYVNLYIKTKIGPEIKHSKSQKRKIFVSKEACNPQNS